MERAPAALTEWLVARFDGPVEEATPTTSNTSGFDSEIHLLHLRGPALPEEWRRPLVLRVKSDADRQDDARREAAVQGWLADRGYPAPRVLHVFGPGELLDRPAQVMARLPGSVMLDRVRRAPWTTRQLVQRLAGAQADLHQLPVDGFPSDEDLVDRRLGLPRHVAAQLPSSPLAAALERIEALLPHLRSAEPSVCHGDFHPLNVLVDGERVGVVDWTDAGLGDRHGDVARTLLLFEVGWIAAETPPERAALRIVGPRLARSHRRSYERHLPLDDVALARWRPLHLLHTWSQTIALHAGLLDRDGGVADDRTERVPEALADELARRFHAATDDVLAP